MDQVSYTTQEMYYWKFAQESEAVGKDLFFYALRTLKIRTHNVVTSSQCFKNSFLAPSYWVKKRYQR
jgi:hypothetical protein